MEKWLKAVMAARGARHEPTHDIDRLLEKLAVTGAEVALDRYLVAELTQYAVPLCCDELLDAESLEREILVVLVDEVAEWVAVEIASVGEYRGKNWGNVPHRFQPI